MSRCPTAASAREMKTKPYLIGIAGGTGSGKTTVVNAILEKLGDRSVVVIQHDAYYKDRSHLPPAKRSKINFDHLDALETKLLIRDLKRLISGKSVEVPVYDFTTHIRKRKGIFIAPAKVVIVEGILVLAERGLRELLNMKIFVETDDDVRFIRRLQRDMNERNRTMGSVLSQYLESVRPMHERFVAPSRKYADLIIPHGHNPAAIEMLLALIEVKL